MYEGTVNIFTGTERTLGVCVTYNGGNLASLQFSVT